MKNFLLKIQRSLQPKKFYLTVTSITVTGNISQINFGPDKEWRIQELKDLFHWLANQSKDYTVHTIVHTTPRQ